MSGALAGYALARMTFRGKTALFYLYLSSLMVPLEAYVVPMLFAFAKGGLADTYTALILPSLGNVFAVIIFRQFFLKFPSELEEAARLDGASPLRVFWLVALPLARAPLIASTIIVFTQNFNNFLWPLLITFSDRMKTLPVGIAALTPGTGSTTQLESFGPAMAAVTLLSLPSVFCFLFLQRYFIVGLSSGSLKG
jgi:multiple sugar transport system permease protein